MAPRKVFILSLAIIFFISGISPLYANGLAAEYLCELGIKFYQQGRFIDALHELRKVLIISPGNETAQKYIGLIEEQLQPKPAPAVEAPPIAVEKIPIEKLPKKPPVVEKVTPQFKVMPAVKEGVPLIQALPPVEQLPKKRALGEPALPAKTRVEAIQELLEKIEKEKEVIPLPVPIQPTLPKKEVLLKEEVVPGIVILDESLKEFKFPIEIEKGKSIIIKGKNIKRFLVTQPNILSSEKINPDEILVTGTDIGYTYLHVWDDTGRLTLDFLVTPVKPVGPTYEEVIRKEQEEANNFKLRYSLGWSSFESGRRLSTLERSFFQYNHLLSLLGPTPYGDLDSYVTVRTLRETTDLTYFTLGLEKGRLGEFKDFSLRAFDYLPGVTNLAFSNPRLRGVLLKSPAFDKKIDYTVFWGREGGGRFGNLSPGLVRVRDSFLSGLETNLSPKENQNYALSVFSGWGQDRPGDLNPFAYDLNVDYGFKKWGMGYEVAYDSETVAYLLNADFKLPKLKLTTEFRNTDKDFKTMTGFGWRVGEVGLLSSLIYQPEEKLNIGSRLNIFQDRLFPNPEDKHRLNVDFDWDATYAIDTLTNFRLDYSLQNELGRISPFRSQNVGLGLYRTFELAMRINTFLNYRHRESKYFTSAASDFINEKIILGLRFPIWKDLQYYLSKELNWTEERLNAIHSRPNALETGTDWYGQLFNSPWYGNVRFIYRDEEDTSAPLSFLSGEDYIEGYAELSFRPKPDMEAFCSTRVRNVWADNPNVNKRIDVNFNSGLRYLWDTGLRWESVGNIEGYVFKDLNSDGLRQRDEAPVEGIKLWLGKNKFQITDEFGYYKFKRIRAAKAYVNLDSSSLPSGFVLTVPATQESEIIQNRTVRLDFGISSRSEISGFVFEDFDGNGIYGKNDKGIKGVVITLEDGKRAITDETGKYSFKSPQAGEHTIRLDLNSLPVYYLPQTPLTKKITLFEGITYIYNIPLKKTEK